MALQTLLSYTKRLEDPDHPLMGPTKKGLNFFGLWQPKPRSHYTLYNIIHLTTIVFIFCQLLDLYNTRDDINKFLNNTSLTVLSVICGTKCISMMLYQQEWRQLVYEISKQELVQLQENNVTTTRLTRQYTNYTRIITFLFWIVVFATNALLIVSPFLKCASTSYRNEVLSGKEPLPQIMFSWFPFDNTKMPGYVFGVVFHIAMGCQGSGLIAVFDMNAVAIMSYLKGQTMILGEKCRGIFEGDGSNVLKNIRECHGLHSLLVKHHEMLNTLLSPPMFVYVLVCPITICGSVVQYTSEGVTTSQKLWVLQYTAGLICQLFLYCWHSNEVAAETMLLDRSVYGSDWWRGDKKQRRLLLLLAAKLDQILILDAGPFTKLSVPTFLEIIKGSYSFFTLFSQMQD